eukprot:2841983-Amphidinium_carterae.1
MRSCARDLRRANDTTMAYIFHQHYHNPLYTSLPSEWHKRTQFMHTTTLQLSTSTSSITLHIPVIKGTKDHSHEVNILEQLSVLKGSPSRPPTSVAQTGQDRQASLLQSITHIHDAPIKHQKACKKEHNPKLGLKEKLKGYTCITYNSRYHLHSHLHCPRHFSP